MATISAIATRRAKALETINSASEALAQKHNVEIQPLPKRKTGDTNFDNLLRLEAIAETLQRIAVATKAAKEADFGEAGEVSGEKEAEQKEAKEKADEEIAEDEIDLPKRGKRVKQPVRSN